MSLSPYLSFFPFSSICVTGLFFFYVVVVDSFGMVDQVHVDANRFAGDEFREPPTFHDEMEKRLRMDH